MKIHKMTASFGMLQNNTLELGDGLNVVCAPNESGKSTWCGFIKAMLYGIDSTAREKGGVKPDKLRFAPWNGAPMAGTMEVEYEGTEITLVRQGRESAPMREFAAVRTGTSTAYRGLDPSAVGETLTGVSKDVFERSAFIGQGKIPVGGSPELEKRIAAIVQTGEEQSSVTEAEERLKAALRRRRYNKSGRLPEIEKELEELRASLSEGTQEAQRGEELRRAKAAALERRDTLLARVAEVRKGLRRGTLDRLAESRGAIRDLESGYLEKSEILVSAEKKLDAGLFGKQEPGQLRRRYETDADKLRALDARAAKGGSMAVNIVIFLLLALAAVAFELLQEFGYLDLQGYMAYVPRVAAGVLALIQLVRILALRGRRKKALGEKLALLAQYGGAAEAALPGLVAAHERHYAAYLAAAAAKAEAAEQLETAKQEQAELEAALLKDLEFTEGDSEAARLKKLLDEAETALRTVREQSAAWEGRQTLLRDPEELKASLAALTDEHAKLTEEYAALALAIDTLRNAGEEISHRVTPRLSARTAELFSLLTDAKYDAVLLDRELKAAAKPRGDAVARDAGLLSTGAVDQLYLAVRLAICELALPEDKSCPIILDDALVNFDDARCEKALGLLRTLAQERQIILFTCHRREAALVKGFADVRVTEL